VSALSILTFVTIHAQLSTYKAHLLTNIKENILSK